MQPVAEYDLISGRLSQVVRQGTANPSSRVRFPESPPVLTSTPYLDAVSGQPLGAPLFLGGRFRARFATDGFPGRPEGMAAWRVRRRWARIPAGTMSTAMTGRTASKTVGWVNVGGAFGGAFKLAASQR